MEAADCRSSCVHMDWRRTLDIATMCLQALLLSNKSGKSLPEATSSLVLMISGSFGTLESAHGRLPYTNHVQVTRTSSHSLTSR